MYTHTVKSLASGTISQGPECTVCFAIYTLRERKNEGEGKKKKKKALLTLLTICIHAHPQTFPWAIVHPPQYITTTPSQFFVSLVNWRKLILFLYRIKETRDISVLNFTPYAPRKGIHCEIKYNYIVLEN